MNTITITSDIFRKSAKIVGNVAAGEHIKVVVKNAADYVDGLRLRVMAFKDVIAKFPLNADDAWEVDGNDAVCILNLNTVKAESVTRDIFSFHCFWILDSITDNNRQLYSSCVHPILSWVKSPDSDIPVDLDSYPSVLDEFRSDFEEFKDDVNGDIASHKSYVDEVINSWKTYITGLFNTLKNDVATSNASHNEYVQGVIDSLSSSLDDVKNTADSSFLKSNKAIEYANSAVSKANSAHSVASNASALADSAISKAGDAVTAANGAHDRVEVAIAEFNTKVNSKADLVGGKIPASQLPGYVDDVLNFDSISDFPSVGEDGKLYVANDTNKAYRWGGASYVEIAGGVALGETSSTAYRGDRGKVAYDHSQKSGNPHGTSASDVGAYTKAETDSKLAKKLDATATAADAKRLGGVDYSQYAQKSDLPDVSGKVDKVTGFGVAAISNKGGGLYTVTVTLDDGTTQLLGVYNKDALDSTVKTLNTAIAAKASTTSLTSHTGNKSNPHGVTAEQVGAYTKAEVDGKVGAIRNVTHNVTRSCSAWKLDVVSESKPDNSITGEAVSYEFTTSNSTEEGIVRVYSNYWVIDANPSHKSHILIEMHESADGLAYIHIYLCVNGDSVDHIISGSELQYFEHYYSLPLDLIDWGKDGWGCGFESSGVFGMAVRICNTTESVTEAEAVVGDLRYTAEQGVLRYDDAALMYCVGVKDRTNTLVDIPITFNDFIIALEMPVLGDIKYGVTKVFDALVTIKITDGVTVPSFSMLDTNGESIPCFYSKDTTDLLNELVGTIPEGGITLTMSITRDVSKPNSLMVSVVKNHVDWY